MYEYKNPYILDFSNIQYYGDVHKIIKEAFDFPDYYGENWDAFWDCIKDLLGNEEINIQIINFSKLENRFPEDAILFQNLIIDFVHYNNDKYFHLISITYR